MLPKGDLKLQTQFSYAIPDVDDRRTGIAYNTYTDAGGSEKRFVVSQFATVYTRKAFPCFDEPEYKARPPCIASELACMW